MSSCKSSGSTAGQDGGCLGLADHQPLTQSDSEDSPTLLGCEDEMWWGCHVTSSCGDPSDTVETPALDPHRRERTPAWRPAGHSLPLASVRGPEHRTAFRSVLSAPFQHHGSSPSPDEPKGK